jgi:apolipoprotein N-acyltransferase
MPDRLRSLILGAAALAVSAACFYFGTGLQPSWWLAWLAPLPVLLVAYRTRTLAAGLAAFAVWLVGGLNAWGYLRGRLGIPVPVVVTYLVLPAVVFALAVLLSRALLRRGFTGSAALALPAARVTFEYLLSVATPNGTALNLAYSQMDCLPLLQLVSVTGIWGVSFVVLLIPSIIAVALSAQASIAWRLYPVITFALVGSMISSYGVWQLEHAAGEGTVTVGLAATDVKVLLFPENLAQAKEMLRQYAGQVDELARRGAEVVVLPEKLVYEPFPEADYAEAVATFRDAAARNHVTLVLGLTRKGESLDENLALIFSPDGSEVREQTYSKHHMVPGFEDNMRPGTDRVVLRQLPVPCGVEICKDLDFPPLSRAYSAEGVGLLLVPAWDFEVDRWLHCRMAVMRGVEGGFSIARAAKQGLLTVSDRRGRVVAEERSDAAAPFATLTVPVPVAHESTVYARSGDWFPWICVVVLAGSLVLLRSRPSRSGETATKPAPATVDVLNRSTSAQ